MAEVPVGAPEIMSTMQVPVFETMTVTVHMIARRVAWAGQTTVNTRPVKTVWRDAGRAVAEQGELPVSSTHETAAGALAV